MSSKICVLFLALGLVLSICCNCAALFKGSKSRVNFNSSIDSVQVIINEIPRGTTPIKLNLSTDKEYSIRFEKDGYIPKTYHIGKELSAKWIILDVLAGGWPIIIDALTGSWYELDQEQVFASMEKIQAETR